MNGVLVRFALAQIAEQQGDREKLFGLLNKVVDPDPQHLEAQIKLGSILLAAGRLDQALAASDIAFGLAPNNPEVLRLRAGVLYKRDNVAGAVAQANVAPQHLQEVISSDSSNNKLSFARVASNLRELLRVLQHTGVNPSLVLLSLRWSARCGSITKMIS